MEQLHIYLEPLFQLGKRPEKLIMVGLKLQIDINRGVAPTDQYRSSAAGQVNTSLTSCTPPENPKKFKDLLLVR